MKFTLTYRGGLKSRGDKYERQRVRNYLSGQHERLWSHGAFQLGKSELAGPEVRSIHDRQFVPLVTRESGLRVALDVLLLQQSSGESPLGDHGDIDNRLKTLFDALRVPQHEGEAGRPDGYDFDGPVYCLVEDDSLIEKVSLELERWLDPTAGSRDVLAVVRVTTRVQRVTYGNISHLA